MAAKDDQLAYRLRVQTPLPAVCYTLKVDLISGYHEGVDITDI